MIFHHRTVIDDIKALEEDTDARGNEEFCFVQWHRERQTALLQKADELHKAFRALGQFISRCRLETVRSLSGAQWEAIDQGLDMVKVYRLFYLSAL